MGIKIAHLSDIHFDTLFGGLPANLQKIRNGDLYKNFDKILSIIKQRNIDIILISGDLFELNTVTKSTINYMCKKFSDMSPVKIFISPGNHDPYTKNSVYTIVDWPENVYVFRPDIQKIILEDKNVCIYGTAFDSEHVTKHLMNNFCVETKSYINIFNIHGDVTNGDSLYNPISLSEIENSGLDYLALGHIHKYSGIKKTGDTYWSYPGNIEGRDFKETGKRGFVIADIDRNGTVMEFIQTNIKCYEEINIDISNIADISDIIDIVKEKISCDVILRLVLQGKISQKPYYIHNIEFLKNEINNLDKRIFYADIIDEVDKLPDLNLYIKDKSIKGEFVRNLLRKLKEESIDKEVVDEALIIGIDALEGNKCS